MEAEKISLSEWASRCATELFSEVLPWWLKNSVDKVNGGFFNNLDQDGSVFDTRKHVWMQGRQVYFFSKMVAEHSSADLAAHGLEGTELLAAAEAGDAFLSKHAPGGKSFGKGVYSFDASRMTWFLLAADGSPLSMQRKPWSGLFCAMGTLELARAKNDKVLRQRGLELCDVVLDQMRNGGTKLGLDGKYGPAWPDSSSLAIPMMILNLVSEIRLWSDVPSRFDEERCAQLESEAVAEIQMHMRPEKRVVLENTRADGGNLEGPDGRLSCPGHTLEAAWFLMAHGEAKKDDSIIQMGISIAEWAFELGWDQEHGGLFYFLDSEGFSPTALEWDMKLWWPHNEAMIAFAYAIKLTEGRRQDLVEKFNTVAAYTWEKFRDGKSGGGEWFGYLNRRGERTHRFKGGPYKGCFHVPRCLYMVHKILEDHLCSTKKIPLVDLQANYASIQTEVQPAIDKVLQSCHFVNGSPCSAFESEFAEWLGVKHAIGVNSGTDALALACKFLGIEEGDEVICPANTFIASCLGPSMCNAKIVLVDCDERYLMDVASLEAAISPRTKAIIVVHLYGQCAPLDGVLAIAEKHGLKVIEDAAQAHGAMYPQSDAAPKNARAGSRGDVGCFSFYPGKNLGAYGDGGALVTNDDELATKVRWWRSWGAKKKYHHEIKGGNSRLDAIQAAVLRVKLRHIDEWNASRRQSARAYHSMLAELAQSKGLVLPRLPKDGDELTHVWHLFVILVPSEVRDELVEYMHSQHIMVGIHYPIPIHKLGAYKTELEETYSGRLPRTENFAKRLVSLPMYPELQVAQIKIVADALRAFFSLR